MSYRLSTLRGDTIAEADCIYDFNDRFPQPFAEPADHDWHALDDDVSDALAALGFSLSEIISKEFQP